MARARGGGLARHASAHEQAALASLRADLLQVSEMALEQDVADVLNKLPSPQQAPQQPDGRSRVPPGLDNVCRSGAHFQVTTTEVSGREHAGAIFTLTYDAEADSVITTGRDGKMVSWAPDGSLRQALQLDTFYACSSGRARPSILNPEPWPMEPRPLSAGRIPAMLQVP